MTEAYVDTFSDQFTYLWMVNLEGEFLESSNGYPMEVSPRAARDILKGDLGVLDPHYHPYVGKVRFVRPRKAIYMFEPVG